MKTNRLNILSAILALLSLGAVALVNRAAAEVDYGDQGSATLASKAWNALNAQQYDDAVAYADKCVELYAAKAAEMQSSLTAFPPNVPADETHKYWALNDVGTILFVKGEALSKKGDKVAAKAAYSRVVNEFGYAQCWDPQGWFWKPAEAAKQKIAELP